MALDQENKNQRNLEDNLSEKKEVCLGHLIKYKVVCDSCKKDNSNQYCPYYIPIIDNDS